MDSVGDGIAPRFMYVRTLYVAAQTDKLHFMKPRPGYMYICAHVALPQTSSRYLRDRRYPHAADAARVMQAYAQLGIHMEISLFLINEHVRDPQRTVRASLLGPCTCRYMYLGCFTQVQSCLRSVVLRVA